MSEKQLSEHELVLQECWMALAKTPEYKAFKMAMLLVQVKSLKAELDKRRMPEEDTPEQAFVRKRVKIIETFVDDDLRGPFAMRGQNAEKKK